MAIRKKYKIKVQGSKEEIRAIFETVRDARAIPEGAGIQLMVSKSQIAEVLSKYLQDLFDLPTEKVILTARLSEDLDLDSIDAIDLVVKLQEYTGRKISPSEFKSVRTIGDVVDKIYAQVNNGGQS